METRLEVTIRDILCASVSLDDGLSAIQSLSIDGSIDKELAFDIARAIEEIILRNPEVANSKLTEIIVKLAFEENRMLPQMLSLLDTRYTHSARRAAIELEPDLESIPVLLDLLGELSHGIDRALRLNLRPLVPFLVDEMVQTMESIWSKQHRPSTHLALHEVHELTTYLVEAGFFEGAEALLNRLIEMADDIDLQTLYFEASLDEAGVLTELGLYDQSREILAELRPRIRASGDSVRLAALTLQLAINETRDDEVAYKRARSLADKAADMFGSILDTDEVNKDGLVLAHLVIGSSILANGWREGISDAIERLEKSLNLLEGIPNRTPAQSNLMYRCLCSLGFAYGMIDREIRVSDGLTYLNRGKEILDETSMTASEAKAERAACNNAIGWICLTSDSDEFRNTGLKAFEESLEARQELLKADKTPDITLLGTRMGLALSKIRIPSRNSEIPLENIRETLLEYIQLFPVDTRSFVEVAISVYNLVLLSFRHDIDLPERLIRLLDDIDMMLSDARATSDSPFIHGEALTVPYASKSWTTLYDRAENIANRVPELNKAANMLKAAATAKINLQILNRQRVVKIRNPIESQTMESDALLAQYWKGQTALANALKTYFENKDYSELATGLHKAARELSIVETIDPDYDGSESFIKGTAQSLAALLERFSQALESGYGAVIKGPAGGSLDIKQGKYDFLLPEDWIGLVRISESYLELIEEMESVHAQPYLNAVFSNMSRALQMMDRISMADRRVLSMLGRVMNERYYLRS
ncbi:MAG: hypothetical protein GF309_08815 [Candidatus Lokiarchaeota archaeon]|nr:hypothetical protein [Candidatus Lokiarchaeota archaeon]